MRIRHILSLISAVLLFAGFKGCGAAEYRLTFDGYGLESEKRSYAEGEKVTVTYAMVATDTDYTFFTDSDDVNLQQEFDGRHGYVFTFTMPGHDVKISVKSRNSMERDPYANPPGPSDPGSPGNCIQNEKLLFDYYEATAASVGGDESTEYCLYSYTDTWLVLAQYRKTEGAEETMAFCTVPASLLDDCMDLVNRYQMQTWKHGSGLEGKQYVVKFPVDGALTRVSSDVMPEDGQEAFSAIREVLRTAWSQYDSALDTEPWFCPECGTRNERRYCSECGLEKPD